jgi:hypothetical protein
MITGVVYINIWSHLVIVALQTTAHKPRIYLYKKMYQQQTSHYVQQAVMKKHEKPTPLVSGK